MYPVGQPSPTAWFEPVRVRIRAASPLVDGSFVEADVRVSVAAAGDPLYDALPDAILRAVVVARAAGSGAVPGVAFPASLSELVRTRLMLLHRRGEG